MILSIQRWTCDGCGSTREAHTESYGGSHPQWTRLFPPGQGGQLVFCTLACIGRWLAVKTPQSEPSLPKQGETPT